MLIFRLSLFSFLIAMSVTTVAAQSSPLQPGQLSTSSPDVFASSAKNNANASPMDRILLGDYRAHSSQFSAPQIKQDDPESVSCLKMRTYKVARDNPRSDSMHPAGYSTCTPVARFRTYSVEGVILPTER